MGIGAIFSAMFGKKSYQLSQVRKYSDDSSFRSIRKLILSNKATVAYDTFGVSKTLFDDFNYPVLHLIKEDDKARDEIIELNKIIEDYAKEQAFYRFARNSRDAITALIAPSIAGFESIKKIIAMQLASQEGFHFYIIADPSLAMSELLKFAVALHDNSIFLDVGEQKSVFSAKDNKSLLKDYSEGLLALSGIDKLKATDRDKLVLAMTKGYYFNDPRSKAKIPTSARILASSSATSGRFVGRSLDIIKKQIPVQENLMRAFHLITIAREENNTEDSKVFKINRADYDFVKSFYRYIETIPVEVPKSLDKKIFELTENMKRESASYIRSVDSHMVVGMIRLAKAGARLKLKKEINEEDLEDAYALMKTCLAFEKKG